MIRPFLKWIRIQNFRSIFDCTIDFSNLTIFVGNNDSGKSNILKAINLFFNGEISPGNPLAFDRDYSKGAPSKKRKAKEIRIQAGLNLPSTFKKKVDELEWTKIWRKSGFHREVITYDGKKEPPSRSRTPAWLKRLNYRYVPAIKDSGYFSALLREMHGTLATKVDEKLKQQSSDLVDFIRQETKSVTADVAEHLNLDSRLQLPPDLGSLFEVLDFETNDKIALSQRGDGIRARHIPIMLDFISSQKKGQLRSDAIWGYEEPENNIEMGQALEYAKAFMGYAADKFQIIMTTHSPIFYTLSQNREEICKAYQVAKASQFETQIRTPAQSELDTAMGVTQFLAPHIQEAIGEFKEKQQKASKISIAEHAIVVEGKFDRMIFEAIIKQQHPSSSVAVLSDNGAAGVKSIVISRAHNLGLSRFQTFALFDNDEKGREEQEKLLADLPAHSVSHVKAICIGLRPLTLSSIGNCGHLVQIQKKFGGKPSIMTESFFPIEYWRHAKEQDWLEKISDEEKRTIVSPLPTNVSLDDRFEELLGELGNESDCQNLRLLVEYKVRREQKDAFPAYAVSQIKRGNIPPALSGLVRLILKILKDMEEREHRNSITSGRGRA